MILASPSTGYQSQFFQPAASSNVPQQPVALAYVQNVIGQTPSNSWPMPSGITTGPFDPIPGSTAFTPNSFAAG